MKFPIFTVMSIMLTGLFFFMYVVFNYGFHNPDTGAFTKIDDKIDMAMGSEQADWTRDILDFWHNIWGAVFVVVIIMNIVCGFIDVIRQPRNTLE